MVRGGRATNPVLLARNAYIGMIETAQNVADRYSLTREEIDAFALRSQQDGKAARDRGRFAKEIMTVPIAATKKTPARVAEHDEFIRDDTTAETLAALPVQPGTTQMTAANSTPLTDGASAVVVASGEKAAELGVQPLARVVSSAVYGIDPLVMGLAPAWAIPMAIRRAGLSPEQIDVWEVHEAFSAQALGVLRELPNQLDGFVIPDDKLTPNGGAVAIGHPFGATGTLRAHPGHRTAGARGALRRHRSMHRIGPGRRRRAGEPQRRLSPSRAGFCHANR